MGTHSLALTTHPDMATSMTLRDYLQQSDERACVTVEGRYRELIVTTLAREGVRVDIARDIAKSFLSPRDIRLGLNGVGNDDAYEESRKLSRRYKGLYDTSYLCCSFPKENKKEQLSFSQEVDLRHIQFDNFLNKCVRIDYNDVKTCVRRKVCRRYCDFLQIAKYFIDETVMRSKVAYIILNGHGGKSGMCLQDEDNNIPWDRAMNDLETALRQRMHKKQLIPEVVHLVFAQCDAHCRTVETTKAFVNVVTFTNASSKSSHRTHYVFETNAFNQITASNHFELEAFGRQLFEQRTGKKNKEIVGNHTRKTGRCRHASERGNVKDYILTSAVRTKRTRSLSAPDEELIKTESVNDSYNVTPQGATEWVIHSVHDNEDKIVSVINKLKNKRKKFKTKPPQDFRGSHIRGKTTRGGNQKSCQVDFSEQRGVSLGYITEHCTDQEDTSIGRALARSTARDPRPRPFLVKQRERKRDARRRKRQREMKALDELEHRDVNYQLECSNCLTVTSAALPSWVRNIHRKNERFEGGNMLFLFSYLFAVLLREWPT